MNCKKYFFLSLMLLSFGYVDCMENGNNESKKELVKKRINIDYQNITWGNDFEKLPQEIVKEIFDYIFSDSNINELIESNNIDGLMQIYDLKRLNKGFNQFLLNNYSEQLKRISKVFQEKIIDTLSYLAKYICNSLDKKMHLDLVKRLIKINATGKLVYNDVVYKEYPILIHVTWQGYQEIVELLIENKTDINVQDEYGSTALMFASSNGYKEIVKLLIDSKADINIQNKIKETAFTIACIRGYQEIVKLLIEAKSDLYIQDEYGHNVLMRCCANGNKEIVKLLIDAKVNLDIKSSDGMTAFKFANSYGKTEISKLLMEAGAVNLNLRKRIRNEFNEDLD